jgi:hypothetical protein
LEEIPVVHLYECGNELLGYMKDEKLSDRLADYQFLRCACVMNGIVDEK